MYIDIITGLMTHIVRTVPITIKIWITGLSRHELPGIPRRRRKATTHVSQRLLQGSVRCCPPSRACTCFPSRRQAFASGKQEATCHGGCHLRSLRSVRRCPCPVARRRFNERRGVAVPWVWQEGGGRRRGARARGEERAPAGRQQGKRMQPGVCFPARTHSGQGGTGAVMGPFTDPGVPGDERPWSQGPTSASEPLPSQQDRGVWDPGWGWVRDRGTWRGPRTWAGVPGTGQGSQARAGVPGPGQGSQRGFPRRPQAA